MVDLFSRQAPATLDGGGSRGERPRGPGKRFKPADRKKMHAVARSPIPPAMAVRRTIASRANTAVNRAAPFGACSPLSIAGAAITTVKSAVETETEKRKKKRWSQNLRERGAILGYAPTAGLSL